MSDSAIVLKHWESLISHLATRYVVVEEVERKHPHWKAIMSKRGYSVLADAIAHQVLTTNQFNWCDAVIWVDAIDEYLSKANG